MALIAYPILFSLNSQNYWIMKKIELQYSEVTNAKQIVFSEKKSNITFVNQSSMWYFKTHIDDCVFTASDGKKCDYKLEKYSGSNVSSNKILEEYKKECGNGIKYFIELKGRDIESAVQQLENTIAKLAYQEKGNYAIVIFSNGMPISSTELMQIKGKFKKKYQVTLSFERTGFKFSLS